MTTSKKRGRSKIPVTERISAPSIPRNRRAGQQTRPVFPSTEDSMNRIGLLAAAALFLSAGACSGASSTSGGPDLTGSSVDRGQVGTHHQGDRDGDVDEDRDGAAEHEDAEAEHEHGNPEHEDAEAEHGHGDAEAGARGRGGGARGRGGRARGPRRRRRRPRRPRAALTTRRSRGALDCGRTSPKMLLRVSREGLPAWKSSASCS